MKAKKTKHKSSISDILFNLNQSSQLPLHSLHILSLPKISNSKLWLQLHQNHLYKENIFMR